MRTRSFIHVESLVQLALIPGPQCAPVIAAAVTEGTKGQIRLGEYALNLAIRQLLKDGAITTVTAPNGARVRSSGNRGRFRTWYALTDLGRQAATRDREAMLELIELSSWATVPVKIEVRAAPCADEPVDLELNFPSHVRR